MRIITVKDADTAAPLFAVLGPDFPRQEVNLALAEGAATLVQDHLRERDSTHPNRLGGNRTHFWNAAAEATTAEADDEAGYVNIAGPDGLRHQLEGGTIRPVNARALTIPVHPAAHGKRASDFAGQSSLILFGGSGGTRSLGIIVLEDGSKGLQRPVLFVLAASATKGPDPSVLPTDDDLAAAAAEAGGVLVEELTRTA